MTKIQYKVLTQKNTQSSKRYSVLVVYPNIFLKL